MKGGTNEGRLGERACSKKDGRERDRNADRRSQERCRTKRGTESRWRTKLK